MLITVSTFWLLVAVVSIVVLTILGIALFFLHSYAGLKLFIDRDVHITDKAIEELSAKYPKVSRKFIKSPKAIQMIENNQEIKNRDDRLEQLEKEITLLKEEKKNDK